MSISNIGSTPPQSVNGLVVSRYTHPQRPFNEPRPAAVPTPAGSPSDHANQLASAIAAALAQLGLTTPTMTPATTTAAIAARGASDASAGGDTVPVSQPLSPKTQHSLQQYKTVASTFSSLAQALESGSYGIPSASSGAGNLSVVFQSLWASLGASSDTPANDTPANASADATPTLQSFLQTLAQHFSESGVSGLRGMFIDTVA